MSIKLVKKKKDISFHVLTRLLFWPCLVMLGLLPAVANAKNGNLSDSQLEMFAQNNILFYDPGACISKGGNSSICGSTAREKYWTALGKYFDDPIHKAGIMGNMRVEGQFSPTSWQCGNVIDGSGNFIPSVDWDLLYNHSWNTRGDNNYKGVGSVGITWDLSKYLHYLNDNAPELLEYLKDPVKYSFNYCHHSPGYGGIGDEKMPGDETLKVIGDADFSRFVELEVKYAMEIFAPDTVEAYRKQNFSTPYDAAKWWAMEYERGEDYLDPSSGRMASAEQAYDDFANFSCSSASAPSNTGSSGTVSGSQITWIGDSYSAHAVNLIKEKFPGITFGEGINMDSSTIQSCKNVALSTECGANPTLNPSGLEVLKRVIDAGELKPYLVFALGTNNGWTEEYINTFENLIRGKDVKVVLVTSKTPLTDAAHDYSKSNQLLQKLADENDNIIVADWTAVYSPEYFEGDPDKIHPVTSPGYDKWVGVIADALATLAGGGSCNGGANPIITLNGNQYMFPLAYASKDNYLQPGTNNNAWFESQGLDYYSVLSRVPCHTPGVCHHGNKDGSVVHAFDLGLNKAQIDGDARTSKDYPDLSFEDLYYYSDGVKVLAFVEGTVVSYGHYDYEVNPTSYVAKCAQMYYRGVDGNLYWLTHIAYDDSIHVGDTFRLGDVLAEVGPPPCACGTQSHLHINIVQGEDPQEAIYDIISETFEALPETRIASASGCNTNICANTGSTTGTSGFDTAKEAAAVIIEEYMSMSSSNLGSQYGLALPDTNDYHDNCVAFSTWFINHYTDIFYDRPPDGHMLVDDFYSRNKSKYDSLDITDTPSVYSVASWSVPVPASNSGNHTGIVVGINEEEDTILIAEAGWNLPDFTGVHEYALSEFKGEGKQYINLNKYLRSNTELK